MTDKSFGDHHNRNVVKNPLLSTAVTGLSIEDLTHNAVLMPVSLSQEVSTRSAQQNTPQSGSLLHTEHAVSSYPAGDANSNLYPPQYPPTAPPSITQAKKPLNTQQNFEKPMATVSKASVKSDDDFDVNEYFARLHGSRYVSAPLHSALKEDKNANLEATEENLEEINLNEPDKVDVQQSLTADIAQNFSQLPTVLPQVASAVFNSFTNMLQTRMSRDPTPEVSSGYQEVQFERPSEPKEVKEMLPPPKDLPKEPGMPPSIGTSNYRLPPKKKYAQIPGLSSGETAQSPFNPFTQSLPHTSQNTPQYFVPSSILNDETLCGPQTQQDNHSNFSQSRTLQSNVPTYFTPPSIENVLQLPAADLIKSTETVTQKIDIPNVAAQNIPEVKAMKDDVDIFAAQNNPQFYGKDTSQATVLPPPPMFANQPKRDSQTGVGKSVLPPSVARRIGANQPIIKQQTHQVPSFSDNIFTPPSIESCENKSTLPNIPRNTESLVEQRLPSSTIHQSAYEFNAQTSLPHGLLFGPVDQPPVSVLQMPSSSEQPWSKPPEPGSQPSIGLLSANLPAFEMTKPPNVSGFSDSSSVLMQSSVAPPPLFATPNISVSSSMPPSNNQQPVSMISSVALGFPSSNAQVSSPIPSSNLQPVSLTAYATAPMPAAPANMFPPQPATDPVHLFAPASNIACIPSNDQSSRISSQTQETLPPPPMFFNPSAITAETKEFPPINSQSAPPPEPSKSVTEPPKATGNVNYRMTKKRPQYYAGPIGGVGAISNNVKPVIAPVNTGLFQGALFTPQQENTSIDHQAKHVGTYSELTPFDISHPAEIANVALQPETQECNTVFDMSRPTTDNYYDPKQESSGFGLLGSLKSKLGSLDINKIQNTVTTFFDPTYNETKKNTPDLQEHTPYGQQQYGNPQSSTIEVFVPTLETTPAYGYNYQMPYQNQYDSFQAPQQYHESQAAQSYHPNPQSIGNYFSDADMQRYQDLTEANIINPYVPSTGIKEIQENEGHQSNAKSREEINASRQPDIEIQKSCLAYTPDLVQCSDVAQSGSQAISSSGPHQTSQTNLTSNVSTNVVDVKAPVTFDTINVAKDASIFLANPFADIPQISPPKDFMTSENQQSTRNILLGFDTVTQSLLENDQTQENNETNVPSSSLNKNIAPIMPPNSHLKKSQLHEALNQRAFLSQSPESALTFFDNPTQIQSKVNVIPNVITPFGAQLSFEDKDVGFGAAASFFDIPVQTSKDFGPIKNKVSDNLKQPKIDQKDLILTDELNEDVENIMSNIQTQPSDFFSTLIPGDAKIHSIFSSAFDLNKLEGQEKNSNVITGWPDETRPLDMSTAPLFGLSTMLANKTKELQDLETEIKNMVIQEPTSEASYLESRKSEESENKDDVPELNICETCREVNKPDEWERDETDDLTTQLIENITSPILLSNAVEVPLTESNTPADDDREDFDTSQCDEISHITEETIEAIQVQAATELLDDDQKLREYGWSDEVTYSEKEPDQRDYTFEQPTGLEQHNYGLPVNPNTIGFFGNNSKHDNISDKMKTDFESKENVTKVLPRQISVPTAPPEEDDGKSEGLDVHSIEQDASKDFPIFEEFVIEPDSGNSDDDEYPRRDTFSSRVDKYKNKGDAFSKSSPTFNIPLSTSPAIAMPSYFDTGNYAADTHYRNSLSSSAAFTFGTSNQVSIPPGFEEEFQSILSCHKGFASKIVEPFIPETSTQTRPIYSPTFSTARQNIMDICVTTASQITTIQDGRSENVILPDFKSFFGNKVDAVHENAPTESKKEQSITSPEPKTSEAQKSLTESESNVVTAKVFSFNSSFGDTKQEFETKSPTPNLDPIPRQVQDPNNFFEAGSDRAQKSESPDQGSNRLASYFSSPAKSDHTKSFFELSQSQNHYRQELEPTFTEFKSPGSSKHLFNPNVQQNIPHDQYVANFNLMRDLTTPQQPDFKPEQIVRHVNYFTIEYDNEKIVNDFINDRRGPKKAKPIENSTNTNISEEISDEKYLMTALNKCQHCCKLTVGYAAKVDNTHHDILTDFNVKKCMDGNTEQKKETSMEVKTTDLERKSSVMVDLDDTSIKEEGNDGVTVSSEPRSSPEYSPVRHHWFYRTDVDGKSIWRGFSVADSKALEEAYQNPELNDSTVVATDGGRFDVNVKGRLRVPVYWSDNPTNVMRCSWFYKGTTDARYVPYTEAVAEKLEEEYRHGMTTGEWHRRLVLPNNEMVVMHGPAVMVHFLQAQTSDAFSTPSMFTFGKRVYRNPPKIGVTRDQTDRIDHLIMLVHGAGEYRHQKEKIQSTMRPRVVRRGHDESEIEEVEPSSIDHLLLMCHGVGSACDMRFRNVEEVVDDFRATSLQLIQSHYKEAYDSGKIGRVEVLPISWHATLHSGETGVDRRLARVTLDSIPRLRNFTNDTVLDVLFYTSPVFCQTILNTVCDELNRIYKLFRIRNPSFSGGVSLGGHSLGSVILYDLLCHQLPESPPQPADKRYVTGAAGTGQPSVRYPQLQFSPDALYALGSPIAIFECIRGVDLLGTTFALPTCKNFFNIFHPYDPIAYRIEPLINPTLRDFKPYLIPHHKGRKRMHLELKDTMARVGADIKQKLIESIKSTWTSMWKTPPPAPDCTLEKVVEEELEKEPLGDAGKDDQSTEEEATPELLGALNGGRRVDYVLQEAPFEMINEYLFAMSSHVGYWESEDTMLLMLREIYAGVGVRPDCSVPQPSLTVLRARTPTDETVVLGPTDFPSTSKGPS